MIYGIGIDLVALDRVETLLARWGARFAGRVLMPHELDALAVARRPVHFIAQRYAAKEACAKALGLGLRHPASLHQIGVRNDARGRPLLVFGSELSRHLVEVGVGSSHVSLTDERDLACALVVLECAEADR